MLDRPFINRGGVSRATRRYDRGKVARRISNMNTSNRLNTDRRRDRLPWLPHHVFTVLWRDRALAVEMAAREFKALYRTSFLGVVWALLNPLLALAVYTFVFGLVLKVKWQEEVAQVDEFALILFTGMIVFYFFADCILRSPGLMLENVNYIKMVVFPLEIMSWVVVAGAFIKAAVSFAILLIAIVVLHGVPPWTAIFLPLIIAPIVLLALAIVWFLSATGVYIRDLAQIVGPIVTLMFFLSPVFYPISALPEALQPVLYLNPVSFIIQQTRDVLLSGTMPNFWGLLVYFLVAWGAAWAGLFWFSRTKRGFADVL